MELYQKIGSSYNAYYDEASGLVPAIFVSDNKNYDTMYDDDCYKIDTTNIKSRFIKDPELYDMGCLITFETIKPEYIELIYFGTGDSLY